MTTLLHARSRSVQRILLCPLCLALCKSMAARVRTAPTDLIFGSIPLAFALILFVYLHRRHVRKLRSEDAEDKHKSLDFGMGPSSTAAAGRKKKGKGGPEMIVTDYSTDREIRRERGLSMDMGSPYILPPGLQNSRDSLHSLSRLHNGDDRYRPATTFFGADTPPIPSYASSRKEDDDSSSHTSSSGHGYRQEGMKQDLLRNAQRMSRSLPPAQRRTLLSDRNIPQLQVPEKAMEIPRKGVPPQLQNGGLAVTTQHDSRESYMSDGAGMRKSNNYLGPFIHSRDHSVALLTKAQSPPPQAPESLPSSPPPVYSPGPSRGPTPPVPQMSAEVPRPPRLQSVQAAVQPVQQQNFFDDESDYGDDFKVTPPSPTLAPECQHPEPLRRSLDAPMQAADEQTPGGLAANDLGYNVRRLSTGVRPLPPDDPSDNPEQRANRIRSFYKEYFDESRPGPSLAIENYYQDYSDEYLGDATVYDPVTGQFVVGRAPSYAQPFTRRAMTPPPRAPPRFQGGQRHHATMSTMSSGRFMPREPRAFSSASARFGPPGRGPPRKAMPPPAPLRILPTPHMLREDSFAMPLDFAPPTSYKDRQAGRPASPRGGMLPYSPTLPARTPLVSSFQDLAVMPSP